MVTAAPSVESGELTRVTVTLQVGNARGGIGNLRQGAPAILAANESGETEKGGAHEDETCANMARSQGKSTAFPATPQRPRFPPRCLGSPMSISRRSSMRRSRRSSPAPADGVLPDRFFSTSNLPTYVRLESGWQAPSRPRMDCAIVRRSGVLEAVEPRRVRRGDQVLTALDEHGKEGVVVYTEGFLGGTHGANEFQFMGTEVSRERPVNYEDLARRLQEEKRSRRLRALDHRARRWCTRARGTTSNG